mgnify:CR=1 FL=1
MKTAMLHPAVAEIAEEMLRERLELGDEDILGQFAAAEVKAKTVEAFKLMIDQGLADLDEAIDARVEAALRRLEQAAVRNTTDYKRMFSDAMVSALKEEGLV